MKLIKALNERRLPLTEEEYQIKLHNREVSLIFLKEAFGNN